MKLMKASLWAEREFSPGSRPDRKTLRRWVERGAVAGRIIDGRTYIFEHERAGVPTHVARTVDQLLRE